MRDEHLGNSSLLSVVPSQAACALVEARPCTTGDPRLVALPMLIAVSLLISRLIHTRCPGTSPLPAISFSFFLCRGGHHRDYGIAQPPFHLHCNVRICG